MLPVQELSPQSRRNLPCLHVLGQFSYEFCCMLGAKWVTPCPPDWLSRFRDGLPYCEADYHTKFGIRCDGCEKYITGRVLEVRSHSRGWHFEV